jgi:hypothetical protein
MTEKKCNGGFGSTALLAGLPLLLSLFFFIAQLYQVLHLHSATHFRCRTTLLKGQEQLSELLARLLQLNSRARVLQTLEAAAERALQASLVSGNPAAIAAAKAQLAAVHAQQMAFAFVQNTILSEARLIAAQLPARVMSAYELSGATPRGQKQTFPFGLAVEPVPARSRSPVYRPVTNFETAQAIGVGWSIPTESFIPSLLSGYFQSATELRGRCAATIKKEKHQWSAELTRVKL